MSDFNKNDCPYLEKKCEDIKCPCPKFFAYRDANDPRKVAEILTSNHFDTTLPAWELIFSMQQKFESRFHDINNISKEEMDHWIDRYLVCIEDEIREIREYLNIYAEPKVTNKEELKKEVIDILHFVMDTFICGNASAKEIEKAYRKRFEIDDKGDLLKVAYEFQHYGIKHFLKLDDNFDLSILKAVCSLSDMCALVRQQISWKHWKKPNEKIDMEKLYHAFAGVFFAFMNLCILTMDKNEIKDIYVKKNVENIQRQFYGY